MEPVNQELAETVVDSVEGSYGKFCFISVGCFNYYNYKTRLNHLL